MKHLQTTGILQQFLKRMSLLTAMLSLFVLTGNTQNYPFPQNYEYPYGNIYTGNVESQIQSLYNTWETAYYVEGTANGQEMARIKFVQENENGTNSVSEGVAYGMLIFVYTDNSSNNTQDKFNRLWRYYKYNSNSNGVMNWKVNAFTGQVTAGSGNANGATDAELDAAQALLMAHKQWGSAGDINYLQEAKSLIYSIYNYEVNSNLMLKPGDAFDDYKNPCYFITNAMQLFAEVDASEGWNTGQNWETVITNSYNFMASVANGSTGLIPDWAHNDGSYIDGVINSKFESYFGYDAIRIPWRLAQAYAWYGHTQAHDLAYDITNWVSGAYSSPAGILDGYHLDGSPLSGEMGSWGTGSNACFKGGLSMGSMVDDDFSTYMSKCWENGSVPDVFGAAYYTRTTQLIFMLVLTGNMPNFWDMKPVPELAETNADGNQVILEFSKDLTSTTSTTGWVVTTYPDETFTGGTTISASSVSVSGTTVTLTLASDISEPYTFVSYSGNSIVSSSDGIAADAFTDFEVTNKITNMEPYPIQRFTDVLGTTIKIVWSKEIDPASLDVTDFSFTVNGTTVTLNSIEVDADDATITNLAIDGGTITTSVDELLLTFAGGSITGTSSSNTAKAFTDAEVQNFYMSVDCYMISDFAVTQNLSLLADGGASWTIADPDPEDASNAVGHYSPAGAQYEKAIGTFADPTDFQNAIFTDDATLSCRVYVVSNTASEGLFFRIANSILSTSGSYWDDETKDITIPYSDLTTGAWVDVEVSIPPPTVGHDYDFLTFTGTNGNDASGSSIEFYIDDIEICPPAPTVSFENGKVLYDGSKVEIRFSTAMQVPTNLTAVTIKVGGTAVAVTEIAAKQGDATTLVFTLETAVSNAASVVTATAGTTLTSADGRANEAFTNEELANLYGITVTTGWRDDFASSTDYVTENVGGDFTIEETVTDPGYLSVTFDGSEAWSGLSIQTYVDNIDATKEVMDLTSRELVEFKYRINGTVPSNLYFRVDFKDLINCYDQEYASDAMSWQTLSPSTDWQTVTFDVSSIMYNQYTFEPSIVDIDKTNIYQSMMYFITDKGDAANSNTPTNLDGIIEFDYISIGSALYLSNVTEEVEEGGDVNATSSADGQIYIVPQGTTPMLSALQEAVFDGLGVVVDATADVEETITLVNTDGDDLKAGYYQAYAYDPTAGAISAKVGIDILDVTAPIITDYSSGDFASNATVSVTVNEDAMVYMIPTTGVDITSWADIVNNQLYNFTVAADISTAINLSEVTTVGVGDEFVFIALDYATPIKNISNPTTTAVTVINPALTMTVSPVGEVEVGDPITVTPSRPAMAYLVLSSVLVQTDADLTGNAVASVDVTATSGNIVTTGIAEGEYYVYVSDGTDIVGPSQKIIMIISNIPVESISALSPVSVEKDATEDVLVSFTPGDATSKAIDLTFDSGIIDVVYDEITTTLAITGVTVVSTPTQLTLTSVPDGATTTISVTVTCPTVAPTSTEVPNVTTCSDSPNPLLATFAGAEEAVWYESSTATTPLFTGNTFAHGETSGVHTYYVAKMDGCESSDRVAVDLSINATPQPTITAPASICDNEASVTLTASPTGGSWSGAVTSAVFDPATATLGDNDVTYTLTQGGCTGEATATITVNAAPTITSSGMPTEICKNDDPIVLASYVTPNDGTFTLGATPITEFNPATQTTGNKTINYVVSNAEGCDATESFTINVKAVPDASLTGVPATICEGEPSLNLVDYTSVSTGTFSDNLANVSGSTFTPSNVGSSTITHTVTSNGCTGVATASITVNPLPQIDAIADLCSNGNPVTLSATPATGTWLGTGVTGDSFDPATAGQGTHTISYVVDGCENTSDVVVNHATPPTVNNVTVEEGTTVEDFVATGATDYITWYDDAMVILDEGVTLYTSTDNTAVGTDGTVYTYYVTNTVNGCESNPVTVTLTVSSCTVGAPTDVSAPETCDGDAIPTLTATGTELSWYDADGVFIEKVDVFDPSSHISGSGTYTFKVSQTDGCEGTQATTTVTVNALPSAPTVTNASICEGVAAGTLSAEGTNVEWEDDLGTNVESGATYTPSDVAVGIYSYYAKSVSAQGCESALTEATYTIKATPVEPSVDPETACEGEPVPSLDVISGSNIKWYDAETATVSIVTGASYMSPETAPNTYTYYATQTVNSCESDKIGVSLTIFEIPEVTISADASICIDAAPISISTTPAGGTLSGTGVFDATATFDPSLASSGLQTITFDYTSTDGCSNSATHDIDVIETTSPTVTGTLSILIDETIPTLTATGGASYTWYNEDMSSVIKSTATYAPEVDNTVAGEYTYQVTNTDNTCESAPTQVIFTVSACSTPAPTVTNATMCVDETVPELTASGTTILWYNEAGTQVGTGTSFTPTTITAAGTYNFYASQTVDCESSKTKATLTVNALPSITMTAVPALCSDSDPLALGPYATPTGGEWAGNGVSVGSNTFTPEASLDGTVNLTYTYLNATTGCENSAQSTIQVTHVAPPVITNTPVVVSVDVTPEPFVATGTTIKWYSDQSLLNNIANGTEYQADARSTVGDYKFYATQTVNLCVSDAVTATLSVTDCLTDLPVVSEANSQICVGEAIPAFNASGTLLTWYDESGTAIHTGTTFTPAVDNTVADVYNYTVTNTDGCESSEVPVSLTVNALPNVTFSAVTDLCTTDAAISLNDNTSPDGGLYTGDLTSADVDPAILSVDSYTVTYTYDNGTCTNSAEQTFSISDCSIPVESITINGTVEITTAQTRQLTVQVSPGGAAQTVTWVVDDPTVLEVSAGGLITPLKAGNTTLYAVATDGSTIPSNVCAVTINEVVVPVESVLFNNSEPLEMNALETLDISQYVEINPATATDPVVTYSTTTSSYASIDESTGVVSANDVSVNRTALFTVTVTAGGVTKQANIEVAINKLANLVQSIVIPSELNIEEGGSETISVSSITSNADDQTVTWSIISGTGGTIDPSSGDILVTGSADDQFTVIATANDASGVTSNECVVTVVDQIVPVTSISLDVTTVSLMKDETQTVTITFNPEETTETALNPEIGTAGVVSVTQLSATQYQIEALKGGTQQVVFRSTANTAIFASVSVTVTELVESIVVSSAGNATSLFVDETLQMSADVLPTTASDQSITWSSSDETFATVSASGLVTAHQEGPVSIIATADDGSGISGTFYLSVMKVAVSSINLSASALDIEIGKTEQVTYEISPDNATYAGVDFSSSDETVATVDQNGVITVLNNTENIDKTVTITVTSVDDPSIFETVEVTVIAIQADKAYLQYLYDQSFFVDAQVADGEIIIGYAPGQVPRLTYNEFNDAWAYAQDVLDDQLAVPVTQQIVDDAADRLYEAIRSMGYDIQSIDSVDEDDVVVYPTVFTSELTVKATEIVKVTVFNAQAHMLDVIQGEGQSSVTFTVDDYAQGVYYLVIQTKTQSVVRKAVK